MVVGVVMVVLVVLLLVSGGADILLSLDQNFMGGKQGEVVEQIHFLFHLALHHSTIEV